MLWSRQIFYQSVHAKAFPKAVAFGIKERRLLMTPKPSYEELEKQVLMRKQAEDDANAQGGTLARYLKSLPIS